VIYSEESLKLTFEKGLYQSQTPQDIPDGYSSSVINLLKTPKGTLVPRGSFVKSYLFTAGTPPNSGKVTSVPYPPDYNYANNLRAWGFGKGVGFPSIIAAEETVVPAAADEGYAYMVNSDVGVTAQFEGIRNGIGTGENYTAMCQFKDRIYASTYNDIVRVSGFDFTAEVALTHTVVSSALDAFTCMVPFRDRIFGSKGSRIYFTELRSAGGYPEDWDSGNNFIDCVSNIGDATIHNMFVMGDRIFVFTDVGVYQLYALGDPTGWQMELINTDIRVYGRHGVCLVKNSFIITDRQAIYIFNGSEVAKFGEQINDLFPIYDSVSVFPFEDGVIIQFLEGALTDDGTYVYWTMSNSKFIYFDGTSFSEIVFYGKTSTSVQIIAGFTNKTAASHSTIPSSYLVVITGSHIVALYYDVQDFTGDTDITNSPYTARVTTPWTLITKYVAAPYDKIKRFKKAFLALFMFTNQVVNTYYRVAAAWSTVDTFTRNDDTGERNPVLGLKGPQIAHEVAYKITGSTNINTTHVGNPPIELKELDIIAEGHRSEPGEVTTGNIT
jgi:hypothetical protein